MKQVRQLRDAYESILISHHPPSIKKALLEAIAGQLRTLVALRPQLPQSSQLKSEQTDTYCTVSQLSLNSDISVGSRVLVPTGTERQELQSRILQKQRLKIALNEEIENYEDDYFQLQKVLLTKRDYHESLDARIARRTYEISKESCQRSVPPEQERKSLTHRLKTFFLL